MYRPPTYHPSPVQRGGWYHSQLLMVYIGNRTNATIGGRGIKEVMLWQVIREIDDAYTTIMIFGGNGKEVSYWRRGAGVKSQVMYGYWNLGPAAYSSVDGEEKKGWRSDNIHDPCTHLSLPTDLITTATKPSSQAQPIAPSRTVTVTSISFSHLLAGVKVWCSAPSMYCTPHLVEVAKRASGNKPTPRLQNKLQTPQEEDRGGWPQVNCRVAQKSQQKGRCNDMPSQWTNDGSNQSYEKTSVEEVLQTLGYAKDGLAFREGIQCGDVWECECLYVAFS